MALPKNISDEELNKLLLFFSNEKHRFFFWLKSKIGLRLNEMLKLNIYDHVGVNFVNLHEGYIWLGVQKKGYKDIFPLPPHILEAIKKYVLDDRRIEDKGGFLFYSNKGEAQPLSKHGIYSQIERIRKTGLFREYYRLSKNGRKMHKFTPHSLRYKAINDFERKQLEKFGRIDTYMTMQFSRHRSPISLQSYRETNLAMKRTIIDSVLQ